MDLAQYRRQIDDIDAALLELFCKRMAVSAQIADYKALHRLPVYMPQREQEKLAAISNQAGPEMESYARQLFSCLFSLSKQYQEFCNQSDRSNTSD